jgi:hypothetical protein
MTSGSFAINERIKMRNLSAVVLAAALMFSATVSYSQESPEDVVGRAFQNIEMANGLVQRAGELIKQNPRNVAGLKVARDLYIQAGQLFEQASNIFVALGNEYIKQADIDGVNKAVKDCVSAAQNCNQHIAKLQRAQRSI